jgi:hypothetical protein
MPGNLKPLPASQPFLPAFNWSSSYPLFCRLILVILRYLRPAVLTQFTTCCSHLSLAIPLIVGCYLSFKFRKASLPVLSRSSLASRSKHTCRFAPFVKFAGVRSGTFRPKTLVYACIHTVCLRVCVCLLSSNEA